MLNHTINKAWLKMKQGKIRFYSIIVLYMMMSNITWAQNFGGPDAVGNQIEEDARPKPSLIEEHLTEPWFNWKNELKEEYGLSFGVDYTSIFLNSNHAGSSGDDNASSGMVRFYGSWDLVNRHSDNVGSFVWKLEHRHRYADIPPQGFGFDQGYVGLIAPPFSNEGGRLTNFYWRQELNNGKTTIVAGLLDATDYVDVFALASPWTGFMNLNFSTGSSSVFLPNDAALGIAAATMLTDQLYIIGNVSNAYTDPTEPFKTVDNFFQDNEYFTTVELGWTEKQDLIYLENAHITLWHVDESEEAGTVEGSGVALQYITSFDNGFMPFIRAAMADEAALLLKKSVSVGFGYQGFLKQDQLGVAYNWGEPNDDNFGDGLDDQHTVEVFYRFQLAKQIAITPDIQYIKNPALNPTKDDLFILGLRVRFAF